MTEPTDLAYLVVRERLCRAMSIEPGDVSVQRAHLNMANAYAAEIIILERKL